MEPLVHLDIFSHPVLVLISLVVLALAFASKMWKVFVDVTVIRIASMAYGELISLFVLSRLRSAHMVNQRDLGL